MALVLLAAALVAFADDGGRSAVPDEGGAAGRVTVRTAEPVEPPTAAPLAPVRIADGADISVTGAEVEPRAADDRASSAFPTAWYSSLTEPSSLPDIAREGMTAVLPYHARYADAEAYLDDAAAADVRVLLELPRDHVRSVDLPAVTRFVSTYRRHPALLGWYLADEPSTNRDLGPLSPEDAAAVYRTIKATDPDHPVSIAFSAKERPELYRDAMDVLMFDKYPCWKGRPEFHGFDGWRTSLKRAADVAATEEGFFPIIQAYAHPDGELLHLGMQHRLPTAAEERYMVFTAIQEGATGMFFWARYRSDPAWVDTVLRPIALQLRRMGAAVEGGAVPGLVDVSAPGVEASAFTDPVAGVTYVVTVHHDYGTVAAPITLRGKLAGAGSATLLSDPPRKVRAHGAVIDQTLGPYEVTVYRVES